MFELFLILFLAWTFSCTLLIVLMSTIALASMKNFPFETSNKEN